MKRVLIVEDEQPLREAFQFMLKNEGYTVESAENGKVAVKKLKTFKPDLIMLDMLMPIMDGKTFLKSTDLPTQFPNTKVMVLSNLPNPLSAKEIDEYRVAELLAKANLSPTELITAVKKHLAVT